MKRNKKLFILILSLLFTFSTYIYISNIDETNAHVNNEVTHKYDLTDIDSFTDVDYIELNGNIPDFTDVDTTKSYEIYSELDSLGRAGTAFANIGVDLMPLEKRSSIGMIKPTGWHTIKYDIVDGKYLYNRCHLIGYQLTGENANIKNLITCTRQMNIRGMLEFENEVAEYIKNTNNHVLYRVTPIYKDDNLLASGIVMEAKSVEDDGEGIEFNVFVYNRQDGIIIDYKTGNSSLKEEYNE